MSHRVTATSTGFIKFFDLLLSGEEEHKLFEDFTAMCHDDSMDLGFQIETGPPASVFQLPLLGEKLNMMVYSIFPTTVEMSQYSESPK